MGVFVQLQPHLAFDENGGVADVEDADVDRPVVMLRAVNDLLVLAEDERCVDVELDDVAGVEHLLVEFSQDRVVDVLVLAVPTAAWRVPRRPCAVFAVVEREHRPVHDVLLARAYQQHLAHGLVAETSV